MSAAAQAVPQHTYRPALAHEHAELPRWCAKGDWTPTPNDVYRKLGRVFPPLVHRLYEAIGSDTYGTSMRVIGRDGKPLTRADDRGQQKVVCVRKEWTDKTDEAWAEELGCSVNSVQNALTVLTDPRWGLTARRCDPSDKRRRQYRNNLDALKAFDPDKARAEAEQAEAKTASIDARQTQSRLFRSVLPEEPLFMKSDDTSQTFALRRMQIRNCLGRPVAIVFKQLDDGSIELQAHDPESIEGFSSGEDKAYEEKAKELKTQQVTSKVSPENWGDLPLSPAAEKLAEHPDLERFIDIASGLSDRLHVAPPLPYLTEQFNRLTAASVLLETFIARFKLRERSLKSYAGVGLCVDDVIAHARASPPTNHSNTDPPQQSVDEVVDEAEYERYKAEAVNEAIAAMPEGKYAALEATCAKQLKASQSAWWARVTRRERAEAAALAARLHIAEQLGVTREKFLQSRRQ